MPQLDGPAEARDRACRGRVATAASLRSVAASDLDTLFYGWRDKLLDGYRLVTAWVGRKLGIAMNRKRVLSVMR